MNMTPFIMTRDINGLNGFGLPFSNKKYQMKLSTGSPTSIEVPPTSNGLYPYVLAIFSIPGGASVWVALNEDVELPPDSGTAVETTSEQNPGARLVKSGDVINLVTSNASVDVGVTFYAVT